MLSTLRRPRVRMLHGVCSGMVRGRHDQGEIRFASWWATGRPECCRQYQNSTETPAMSRARSSSSMSSKYWARRLDVRLKSSDCAQW